MSKIVGEISPELINLQSGAIILLTGKLIKLNMSCRCQVALEKGEKSVHVSDIFCGRKGDVFDGKSKRYVIRSVLNYPLDEVINEFYREEGHASPEEFKRYWNYTHKQKALSNNVYVHTFEELKRYENG